MHCLVGTCLRLVLCTACEFRKDQKDLPGTKMGLPSTTRGGGMQGSGHMVTKVQYGWQKSPDVPNPLGRSETPRVSQAPNPNEALNPELFLTQASQVPAIDHSPRLGQA